MTNMIHLTISLFLVSCLLADVIDPECVDTPGWTDGYNGCAGYEWGSPLGAETGWCYDYGYNDYGNGWGTARDNCCVCGGGSTAPEPTCLDTPNWYDGWNGCDAYEKHSPNGPGTGWCQTYGWYDYGPGKAADHCCACGGGSTAPEPTEPTCLDTPNWHDGWNGCDAYEHHSPNGPGTGWCQTYGWWDYGPGKAEDHCCACGGGTVTINSETAEPTAMPSSEPTKEPTAQPSLAPTGMPSTYPSFHPTSEPSFHPTSEPTKEVDVDECELGLHLCDENAACTNVPGSYTCLCRPGFSGDGLTCVDVDECAQGLHNCGDNAVCTNLPGSYSCSCSAGFSGDGLTCVDVDECAQGLHNCGDNAACTNLPGSFSCSCNAGFSGDGLTCVDVDECAQGSHNCDENAACTNLPGSYSCSCNAGFSGDGLACVDVDECAQGTHNCDDNAVCTNLPGSWSCEEEKEEEKESCSFEISGFQHQTGLNTVYEESVTRKSRGVVYQQRFGDALVGEAQCGSDACANTWVFGYDRTILTKIDHAMALIDHTGEDLFSGSIVVQGRERKGDKWVGVDITIAKTCGNRRQLLTDRSNFALAGDLEGLKSLPTPLNSQRRRASKLLLLEGQR